MARIPMRLLRAFHPLQDRFARLRERGLSGVLKPPDQALKPPDLSFAAFPDFHIGLIALQLLPAVPGVIAGVSDRFFALDLNDRLSHTVGKETVMSHEYDRLLIVLQVFLKPFDSLDIQMVRGLVEQQNIGLSEQKADHRYLRLLSARELLKPLILVFLREAKARKQPVKLPFLRLRAVAQAYLSYRAPGVCSGRLLQITDAKRPRGLHDRRGPLIVPFGFKLTCNKTQQRGLTRAVASRYGDLLRSADLEIKMRQYLVSA